MKNIYRVLLAVLLTFSMSMQAQNADYPWQVTVGTNAIDQEADTNTSFPEFFNVNGNWNLSAPFSQFSISRYIGNKLSIGVGMSFNNITKYATGYEMPSPSIFHTVDLMLKHNFIEVLNWQKWDPYIGIGSGWTSMGDTNWMTGNMTVGINYWVNERWGVTFQSDYLHNMGNGIKMAGINQRLDEGGSMRWMAGLSFKIGRSK